MRTLAACLALVLAGPAHALCDLDAAAASDAITGEWTATVVEARITVLGNSQLTPQSPPEAASLSLDAAGTGVFEIKGAEVPMTRLPSGTFHLDSLGDRTIAFARAVEELDIALDTLPCPVADLVQLRAERSADVGARAASVQTDLVLVSPVAIAGVQQTRISETGKPTITLVTTLTLTKDAP